MNNNTLLDDMLNAAKFRCECVSSKCHEFVSISCAEYARIRLIPNSVLLAKACKRGPEPTDVLLEKHDTYNVYIEP